MVDRVGEGGIVALPAGKGTPPPQKSGDPSAENVAIGVMSENRIVVTPIAGKTPVANVQAALCREYKDERLNDVVNRGAFGELISSLLNKGLTPNQAASTLAYLIDNVAETPQESANIVGRFQLQLVKKMYAAGYEEGAICRTLIKLEEQVRILNESCGFELLGLTKPHIRQWLSDIVNAQLDTTRPFPWTHQHAPKISFQAEAGTKLPDIIPQIKIGQGEFAALLKVKHIGKITVEAMDWLFGNQNKILEEDADVPSLDKFTATIRDEVLVFASMTSGNALVKMLKLFSANKFVLMNNEKMAGGVKQTMLREIRKNIWADPRLSTDADRGEALRKAKAALEAGDIAKLKAMALQDAEGKPTSLLGPNPDRSSLVTYLIKATKLIQKSTDNNPSPPPLSSTEEIEYMYALAGFASLVHLEGDSVLSQLTQAGGREVDLTGQPPWISRWFMPHIKYGVEEVDEAMARYAAERGLYGTDASHHTYRPEIVDVRDRVKAFTKTNEVVSAVRKLRAEEAAQAVEDEKLMFQGHVALPELVNASDTNAPAVTPAPEQPAPAQPAPSAPPATAPAAPSIVAQPPITAPAAPATVTLSPEDRRKIIAVDMRRFNDAVTQNNIPEVEARFSKIMLTEIASIESAPGAPMKKLAETEMVRTLNSAEWTPDRIASLMNESLKQPHHVKLAADALYALKLLNPEKANAVITGLSPSRRSSVVAMIAIREREA